MGKSITVHCIGTTKKGFLITAMNNRERAQMIKIQQDKNDPIVSWFAQTKIGEKILHAKFPAMVICPACKGQKSYSKNGFLNHCPVCLNSGITTKGYEKKWMPWQLEFMQEQAGILNKTI